MMGLPPFQGYDAGANQRIQHQHQAIVPSYRFNCCGNITSWGVDLSPPNSRSFYFILQVWRPSQTVNGSQCYSLVDDYTMASISVSEPEITPLPQHQLQFQPYDVLGFYVESRSGSSDSDNGVVLLNNDQYASELVWYASITAQTSQSGSCPYPVGTSGVLSMTTSAAPVLSIAVSTYSCSQSLFTPTPSVRSTVNSGRVPYQTPTTTQNDIRSTTINSGIVVGIVVAFVVCGLCTLLIIIIITSTVIKKHATTEKSFHSIDTSTAISNMVYGMPVT